MRNTSDRVDRNLSRVAKGWRGILEGGGGRTSSAVAKGEGVEGGREEVGGGGREWVKEGILWTLTGKDQRG